MADYTFRPITKDDLPMFKAWLDQPHIGGWWADGGTEARLIEEDLGGTRVDMRIVEHDGTPFAYVQDYDAHTFDSPQYADLPATSRALDTFLGDPAYLGQGHATGYLRARLGTLAATYPIVAVDPDPANLRAIATYQRAGFRPTKITACEDGDPVQVMVHP
ncbi:aminoglycoside 6'-N-acetyltransferase [Cognatiyoonia koreensis]|uniref:Aminoglycoside 6'-N-acetyltransferase n=1 Tax=Cognatiyoonia koreensis TaxID=364200 RepID=A0A1I0N3X6_9RHOB|nr:GNAT family N-acetyltransferase [Cognatiyoonia koreensis]SEV95776.1 aminoglycoside 6'-N-acetyltransferase [Cognatiyoonia koreensis]